MECDYLYGWIKNPPKNSHIHKNLTNTMVKPRESTGNAEEEDYTE